MKSIACIMIFAFIVMAVGGCYIPLVSEQPAADAPAAATPENGETGSPELAAEAALTEDPDETQTAEPSAQPNGEQKEIKECFVLDGSFNLYYNKINMANIEGEWGKGVFKTDEAPKQMTADILGTDRTGSYKYSGYSNYTSFRIDYYHAEDETDFGVNANTGELAYLSFMSKVLESDPLLPDLNEPEAEAEAIAYDWAGRFVDIAEYDHHQVSELPCDPDGDGTPELIVYIHDYARTAAGIPTVDFITVSVTSKGTLADVVLGDRSVSEAMAGREREIENVDIEGSVRAALMDMEPDHGEEFTGDFVFVKRFLALTAEGEEVIIVRVSADVASADAASADTSPDEGKTELFVMLMYL